MDLSGTWFNQLDSSMELKVNGQEISGTYHSKVGVATGEYVLTGRTDTDKDTSQVVGFVVAWQNEYGSSDSVTTWSGIYVIYKGKEYIITTWIKTNESSDPDNFWRTTLINKDIFSRTRPTEEQRADNIALGSVFSHPF